MFRFGVGRSNLQLLRALPLSPGIEQLALPPVWVTTVTLTFPNLMFRRSFCSFFGYLLLQGTILVSNSPGWLDFFYILWFSLPWITGILLEAIKKESEVGSERVQLTHMFTKKFPTEIICFLHVLDLLLGVARNGQLYHFFLTLVT